MKTTLRKNARSFFGTMGNSDTSSILVATCILLFVTGCATFHPQTQEKAFFRARAETKSEGNLRVTAAVLSEDETKAYFDLDLYYRGIQPIWLEIENRNENRVWFPLVSVDPDYFAPLEVAYKNRAAFAKNRNRQLAEFLYYQAIYAIIPPKTTNSGFVFTNLNLGTKFFNVDLVGENHQVWTFTFSVPVPGLRVSHQDVDWETLYTQDQIVSCHNDAELKAAIEKLPFWTKNQDGTIQGTPINIIIVSRGKDLHHVLLRRGWDETAGVNPALPSEGPIPSRYAPVSPLYLYGRPQDAAFRKSRERLKERSHMRLWLSPIRYGEKLVWVGYTNREIKVLYRPDTFRLEPLVDEARTYLLQDLWYSQRLKRFGYVKGVSTKPISEPYEDLQGDPYFTDGFCVVLWVGKKPLSVSEVETVSWEIPSEWKDNTGVGGP